MQRWILVFVVASSTAAFCDIAAAEVIPSDRPLSPFGDYFAVPPNLPPGEAPLPGSSLVSAAGPAPASAPALCSDEFVNSEACDCWQPLWVVRASAVFMERSNPDINAAPFGFDFDFEPGLDLSLVRSIDDCREIEFRYFGIHGWRSDIGILPGVGLFNRSELDSTEINLRRPLGRFALLAGFRWVEFMDHTQFDTTILFPLSTGINVNNHLYGGQIGLDGTLWDNGCRLRLDSFLKAGVYYNHLDSTFFLESGPTLLEFNESLDRTAFVGELGLLGVYEWSDNWALRAGYQLLWLEGVALSPEQFVSLDTSGLFAHGAVVGVEWAY